MLLLLLPQPDLDHGTAVRGGAGNLLWQHLCKYLQSCFGVDLDNKSIVIVAALPDCSY